MSSSIMEREFIHPGQWRRSALSLLAGLAAASAVIVYGAYGDSRAPDSQKDAVPFLVGLTVVGTAILFGVVVTLVRRPSLDLPRWALGMAILAAASIAVFWSGAPILLGVAAVTIARQARPSRMARWGMLVGCLAMAAPVVITLVTNNNIA
jgi:hypothetical protein